jgi:hypothetical protein
MEHKRGDTFDYVAMFPEGTEPGLWVDFVPTAQIRDFADKLVDNVECAWVDPVTTLAVSLHVTVTSKWRLGPVSMDIQFKRPSDGVIRSTRTLQFSIVEDVTRP